jgi:putative ABC transport system permease protein
MRFLEYLGAAVADLARHKLRTLLTMLGMIFGVGAVISMLSIGLHHSREEPWPVAERSGRDP